MLVSILIPVLNYEESLEKTIKKIVNFVKKYEIIILYDITKPEIKKEAFRIAKRLKEKYNAKVIFRFNEKGFGSALRIGFEKAKGDVILVTMGDFCDDPKTIPKMIEKIKEGYDIVVGSRYIKGGGIIGNSIKQRISSLFSVLVNIFSKVKIRDITNAYKLYRRDVIKTIKTISKSFDISCELTLRAAKNGFKIAEVPTIWRNREVGRSKFRIIKESKNYFKWFLFSAFKMPSKITKMILFVLFLIYVTFLFFQISATIS